MYRGDVREIRLERQVAQMAEEVRGLQGQVRRLATEAGQRRVALDTVEHEVLFPFNTGSSTVTVDISGLWSPAASDVLLTRAVATLVTPGITDTVAEVHATAAGAGPGTLVAALTIEAGSQVEAANLPASGNEGGFVWIECTTAGAGATGLLVAVAYMQI